MGLVPSCRSRDLALRPSSRVHRERDSKPCRRIPEVCSSEALVRRAAYVYVNIAQGAKDGQSSCADPPSHVTP